MNEFSYFVAVLAAQDKVRFQTLYDFSPAMAIQAATKMASESGEELISVEMCELPQIEIVEPALAPVITHDGVARCSLRDHLMKGGALHLLHEGLSYRVTSRIYAEPIYIDLAGNVVTLKLPGEVDDCELDYRHVVGECTIAHLDSYLRLKFHLEEIDYGHAIDHLLGKFFAMVAEVRFRASEGDVSQA